MKHYIKIALVILAALMSGCISLKIKTTLPQISYYDISSSNEIKTTCTKDQKMRLELEIPPYLNTTNILQRTSNGQIHFMENAKWVDLPSVLFKEELQKKALKHCLFLTTTSVASKTMHLHITDFSFDDTFAVIKLSYALFEHQQLIKSKILTIKVAINKNARITTMGLAVDDAINAILKLTN